MNAITERLTFLRERLHTAYDGIGHSTGRPYVYFIFPPDQERAVLVAVRQQLDTDSIIHFQHIDILPLIVASLHGQEARRQRLLDTPHTRTGAAESVALLWARAVRREIDQCLVQTPDTYKPVVVLHGLAALHPLGHPTSLMEALAEEEPRDPRTGRIVPIVVCVPGTRPPQSSRRYLFLGLAHRQLDFYRGEEI